MNVGLVQFAAAQSFNVSPKKVPVVQNVLPIAISPSAVDRHRKEVSTFVNFNHLHLKPSSTSKLLVVNANNHKRKKPHMQKTMPIIAKTSKCSPKLHKM